MVNVESDRRKGNFRCCLALSAWKYRLPQPLSLGQVRNMLTKVLKRIFADNNSFTEQGYLQLGFTDNQPTNTVNYYTNKGSLYMTTFSFLPLIECRI